MSPIGHRSSQIHVSIKNCLSRKRRNDLESRTRFNFLDHPDRVPQIVFICLRRGVDLSVIVSQTDRRPLQIIWKPGFKAKSPGVSLIRKANVNIVVRFYFGSKSRC